MPLSLIFNLNPTAYLTDRMLEGVTATNRMLTSYDLRTQTAGECMLVVCPSPHRMGEYPNQSLLTPTPTPNPNNIDFRL